MLSFYLTIVEDITVILRYEYIKIKTEINSVNINLANIFFDELQDDIYNISDKDLDSNDDLYTKETTTEEKYIIYIKKSFISKKNTF